jgi:ribosomal protein S18 acetylase RimI-like enzyme
MEIRPLDATMADALRAFFAAVPEGDRTFFKEDVSDPDTVTGWTTDTHNRRRVAVEEDGTIVGYVAVLPGVGWSSHVGEVRIVVSPQHRRQGLGRELARHGLIEALELGLSKVVVEVVADQVAAVEMFLRLGFEGEALLKDHVRDRDGQVRDLLLLAHRVEDTWSSMVATGIDEAVVGGAS